MTELPWLKNVLLHLANKLSVFTPVTYRLPSGMCDALWGWNLLFFTVLWCCWLVGGKGTCLCKPIPL